MRLSALLLTSFLSLPTLAEDNTIQYYPSANPDAPFSVATQVGNTVYLSGQIPLDENGNLPETMEAQAHQVMKNVQAAANAAGVTLNDLFKCTVMIDDIALWGEFNKVYITYFERGRLPARSAFGADGLAMGAMLEVECMAFKSTD
ncbi:RidA family protein [Alteromonas aestuariivivens]|uniref:RidA family protein n=1 Tax=Alteromonas aestuariivivens TaxID=1938339 RepID=A0A3D8MCT0_9ALTE|nr:RidA family protein [Alteromonas aestuariivivens]RDV28191.1 RidA family protein [Alteromonas aestuariivivens]